MLKRFLLCGLLLHALHAHLHLVTLSLPLSTSGGHLCMHPMHISQLLCTQVACIHTCIHNLSQECGLIVFMAQASKEYTLVPLCVSLYSVCTCVCHVLYSSSISCWSPTGSLSSPTSVPSAQSSVHSQWASRLTHALLHTYIHTKLTDAL